MSTRCHIEFCGQSLPITEPSARIYQHSDGYPSNILVCLRRLYQRLALKDPALKKMPHPLKAIRGYEKETQHDYAKMFGPRIDDAEWAAAEFIQMFRKPMGGNIYVVSSIHGDEAFLYRVDMTANPWNVVVYEREGSFVQLTDEFVEKWKLVKEVKIPHSRGRRPRQKSFTIEGV